jgi:hypothetical protein
VCRYVAAFGYEAAVPVLERLKARGGTSSATRSAEWALDAMRKKAERPAAKGADTPPRK